MTNTKILFCPHCLVDNPEIKFHGEGNGIECLNCGEYLDDYLEDEVRLFGAEKIEDWKNTTDQSLNATKQQIIQLLHEYHDGYRDRSEIYSDQLIKIFKSWDQKEQSTKQLPGWMVGYSLVCFGCTVTSHPSDDQAKPTEVCECHNLVLCEICYYRLHHEKEEA